MLHELWMKIYQHCYDAESNIYALEVYITSNLNLLVLARLLAVVVVSSLAMHYYYFSFVKIFVHAHYGNQHMLTRLSVFK